MKYVHPNKLTLTKIEENDLPRLKELKDESWFFTHEVAIVNAVDEKAWFYNTSSLVLKALTDTEFIGIFKIDKINAVHRSCDVGWDVFLEFRNRGYGKKLVQAGTDFCFEMLNLNRLNTEILSNNPASQRCAESANFLAEGLKRKAVFKCNEYLNSYVYGILKEDWEQLIKIHKAKNDHTVV